MNPFRRYPMSKDKNAQIDCRINDCVFNEKGQCHNISPAITLNQDKSFVCWSETKKIDNKKIFGAGTDEEKYIIIT